MTKQATDVRAAAVPTPATREQRQQFQADFLGRIGKVAAFLQMLDSVPDGLFFLKDEVSRFVWVSKRILRRFGLRHGWEVAGRTDRDFHAPRLADTFFRDEQEVLRSGKPLVGRIEIWFNNQRQLDWGVTTKLPVCDAAGRNIGVLGTSLSSADRSIQAVVETPVSLILGHIQAHFDRLVSVAELAAAAGVSTRHLLRTVRREFGTGVHELVMKTRIQAASDTLLHKKATVGEIAADFGFCDQSAFTRQFRRHTGLTPTQFVRKYGGENSDTAAG